MTDTFANYPMTLTERRAEKENDATLSTPRDTLISVLRRIDEGEINPEALIVCWREAIIDGMTTCGFNSSAPDVITTLGLLQRTAIRVLDNS